MAQVATKKASQGLRGNLPRDKRQPAGGKSVHGAALAQVVLAMIVNHANAEVKQRAELKQNLMLLTHEDSEGHKNFRATLNERRKQIDDAKLAANCKTMQDYFKMNPKAGSEYVRISEWDKLSEACEKGWTPNYDMGWGAIVQEARAVKDNSVASANPELVKQLLAVRNDDKMPAEQKQEVEAALVKEINTALLPQAATTPSTTQNQSASGADKGTLYDQCYALFKDHPIADVEKLMAQIAWHIAEKMKKPIKQVFDSVYAEHIDKAKMASKGTTPVAKPGTSGEHAGQESKKETAEAKGEVNPIHARKRAGRKAHA